MKCSDIQNLYLNENTKERLWFQAGQDFGVYKVIVVVIIRSLCGLKGYGYEWASELRQLIIDLGFTQCRSDRDVWMRVAVD